MSGTPMAQSAFDQLFFQAHTNNAWQDKPVADELLHRLYDTLRMAPTSMNCSPARIVFVKSKAAKEKLSPALMEGNRAKTMAAPVTAIIGYDTRFYENLPKLFPPIPNARGMFESNAALSDITAFRNGTLQGAYLILAARALGSGLRPDVRLRQCCSGSVVLCGYECEIEFPVQPGLRRCQGRLSAQSAIWSLPKHAALFNKVAVPI